MRFILLRQLLDLAVKARHVLPSTAARLEHNAVAKRAREVDGCVAVHGTVDVQQPAAFKHLVARLALEDDAVEVHERMFLEVPLSVELVGTVGTRINDSVGLRVVNRFVVPLTELLGFKGFEARGAAERLLLSLLRVLVPDVRLQVLLLNDHIAERAVDEDFHGGMNRLDVNLPRQLRFEAFRAVRAVEVPRRCVDRFVPAEISDAFKSRRADGADVIPRVVIVAQLVRLVNAARIELPVADLARERFLHHLRFESVQLHRVVDELLPALERLLTFPACVPVGHHVLPHVLRNLVLVLDVLVAEVAGVDQMGAAQPLLLLLEKLFFANAARLQRFHFNLLHIVHLKVHLQRLGLIEEVFKVVLKLGLGLDVRRLIFDGILFRWKLLRPFCDFAELSFGDFRDRLVVLRTARSLASIHSNVLR